MNEMLRDLQAVDPRTLRRALGQFATGVTIVTCLDTDGRTPVGMTANSFTSVSLDPPLVLWALDRKARSFEAFANAERTAFSVLAHDQVALSNRFAQPGEDKFSTVAWEPGLGGVPLIPDPAARFECVRQGTFEGGDHIVLLSRVQRFERFDRRGLAFAQGRYGTVAPSPGTTSQSEAASGEAGGHPYDDFLIPLMLRAYHRLFRAFAPSLTAEDATRGQMRVLSIVSSGGTTSEAELLTSTALSRSSFEEARDALVGSGLLESVGNAAYAITAAGEAKLAELLRQAADRERQSTAALDTSEVELLRALLRKLVLSPEERTQHHQGRPTD